MDKEKIASMLPTVIRPDVFRAALAENLDSDLGGELLIYYREAWNNEDWDPMGFCIRATRHTWAARCKCTACGYDFHAGWASAKSSSRARTEINMKNDLKSPYDSKIKSGISIFEGVDGTTYPGVPEDQDAEDVLICVDGDRVHCPECDTNLTLCHKSKMRGFQNTNHVYRILAGSVENIGPYTALVFWLVSRMIDKNGNSETDAEPNSAAVIDEDGTTQMFLYKNLFGQTPQWEARTPNYRDPCQVKYYSRGAAGGLKVGAWFDTKHIPDQRWQSGEKTGLVEYLTGGGNWPVMYLRFWKHNPNVENLVKAGWIHALESSIDADVMHEINRNRQMKEPDGLSALADWTCAKPSDMLRMTKREVRDGVIWDWDAQKLMCWQSMVIWHVAEPGDARTVNDYFDLYSVSLMEEYVERISDEEDLRFYEMSRYLEKQYQKFQLDFKQGLRYYFDYWTMLTEALEETGAEPGPDERYPRDLRAAHDRLAAIQREKGVAGFGVILKRWGALEWTDGEFCARLPRSESELISEGHTLHHCVGSYGKSHVEGRIIIFIRHRRRPERSWYTLNEDLTGKTPQRIQLHGYKNENLAGKHLVIPQAVWDFVDRWEREVLAPVFQSVNANTPATVRKKKPLRA